MKGIEIFKGYWSVDDVKKSTDKFFVFGDNNARVGNGGQAIIRNQPNTIGIRTKKGPSNKSAAFYTDSDYEINCKYILEDVIKIRSYWIMGKTIVFAKDGYGTGLAKLKEVAPLTFQFLVDILRDFFEFDNCSGNIWKRIPSIDDVNYATYIDFTKLNSELLIPINNSFFNEEYLKLNLNTNYDLIRCDKKTSFLHLNNFKKDQYLMLKFNDKKNYLFVKVCSDSYLSTQIDKSQLIIFEGYCEGFFNSIEYDKYYQTQIKYLCEIDDSGKIIFKKDLFSELIKFEDSNKTTGNPIFYQIKKQEKSNIFKTIFKKLF